MVSSLWDNIFKKDLQTKNITEILRQCYMFSTLTKREVKLVQNIINIRNYQSGETIFKLGEPGVGMYIIAEGCVDIYVDDFTNSKNTESKTQPVFITRLKKGDFFGELALVEESGRRQATAVSSTDAVLLGFFKPNLIEISERSPATGIKIIFRLGEILGRRLKDTSSKITDLKKALEKLRDHKST